MPISWHQICLLMKLNSTIIMIMNRNIRMARNKNILMIMTRSMPPKGMRAMTNRIRRLVTYLVLTSIPLPTIRSITWKPTLRGKCRKRKCCRCCCVSYPFSTTCCGYLIHSRIPRLTFSLPAILPAGRSLCAARLLPEFCFLLLPA